MRQRITKGVRRANLDEMDRLIPHLQRHFTLEGFAGWRQRDMFEVERAEGVDCERASLPHRRSLLEEHSKLRRLQAFDHFVCSLLRSDNLRIGYQLIAIAMIPVGVCVDHHVNV